MKAFLTERFTPHYLRNFLLGLLLVISLINGAASIVQGLPANQLWMVGAAAFLTGWVLARFRIPGWFFPLLASLVGFTFVFVRVGRLAAPAWLFLQQLYAYLYRAAQERLFPDPAELQAAWSELLAGASVLFERIALWIRQVSFTEPIYDPFVLTLVWGLMVWGLSAWTAWALRRGRHPAAAAAPAIFVLGYSLAFVGGPAYHLTPMLAAVLLLVVFNSHELRERIWSQAGTRFPQMLRRSVTWSALLLTGVLVTTAAVIPSISIQDITDFFQELTRDEDTELEESLGLHPAPEQVAAAITLAGLQSSRLSDASEGGLPRQHLINSGPELSEQVAMVISAVELAPQIGGGVDQLPSTARGYYWRSLTYDRYTGTGWRTREIEVQAHQPGDLAITTSLPGQHILRQQVSLSEELKGTVYVAGDLITADHFFSIAFRPATSAASLTDIFGASLDSAVYQADSLLFNFSPQELRGASGIIPTSIAEVYLSLPRSIPDRVLEVAYELTATQPTLYDRALAIESYLRTFPYDLEIPPPPFGEDIDIVDYFLFSLGRGYCDYYATAMVVLARASGLPARFVQGYAGGAYDPVDQVYIVTEDLAHSWVEIYFPGFGWVAFEPTASRPSIQRPDEPLPEIPPEFEVEAGFLEPLEEDLPPIRPLPVDLRSPWLRLSLTLVGAAVLLALAWPSIDLLRLRLLPPAAALDGVFSRLYRSGRRLHLPGQSELTPLEFARRLSARLDALLEGRRRALDDNARADILWLSTEYSRYRYGGHHPGAPARTRALLAWRRLRPSLFAAWLRAVLSRSSRTRSPQDG